MRSVLLHGTVSALVLRRTSSSADEDGNPLCWYNNERSYDECCSGDQAAVDKCWVGTWYTEDFCCHALPAQHVQCFERIEQRVMDKLEVMDSDVGKLLAHGMEYEAAWMQQHSGFYRTILALPVSLWSLACDSMTSPLLWSDQCACCEPAGADCYRQVENVSVLHEYAECCYPVFARRVHDGVDAALEASIKSQLGSMWITQLDVQTKGPSMKFTLERKDWFARGCVISLQDGEVHSCEESHACPKFDCSYLRAFLLTLRIVQKIHPLPDMTFVMSAGDLTMDAFDRSTPVFTRVGTRWTNTIGLPAEWQLHPHQCFKHVRKAMQLAEQVPWEKRQSILIWRGSFSNCRFPRCRMALADASPEGMEACGRLQPDETRNCTWNFTTWLQMPRGRLVWLSRFVSSIDAKFVLSTSRDTVDPSSTYLEADLGLEEFLRDEGLIEDPMRVEDQAGFKYTLAVDGDSAADRLYWQLFMGSVILIHNSPWRVLSIHDMLQPYVHYVPVRYDLSDLVEKVNWLRDNDAKARDIARNAMHFAQRYLTCDGILFYVDRLLRRYADHLQ